MSKPEIPISLIYILCLQLISNQFSVTLLWKFPGLRLQFYQKEISRQKLLQAL